MGIRSAMDAVRNATGQARNTERRGQAVNQHQAARSAGSRSRRVGGTTVTRKSPTRKF